MNGLCECGRGKHTPLAPQTSRARGWVKGQPIRFVVGHSGHKYQPGETSIVERWRVEDRGHDTPCWAWLLHKGRGGYGVVMAAGRTQYAHRYYYELRHGPLPYRIKMDHLCRNRDCVNPEHLEPVTNAENSRRGANCKLDAGRVGEIRGLLGQGWQAVGIADAYGVTAAQVSNIKHGRSWAVA